jgi:large subunit ribosomal protein L10e
MAKNPGRMYRKITQYSYTRREFMGGVPGNRILQYQAGKVNGDFPITLDLIPEERGQIRHTALEAMRITAVRALDTALGRENYYLKVRVYPHHVLRQNKQASGAGADRVSMGMRLAFGKAIGTAARVAAGQTILTVKVTEKGVTAAKDAMRKAYNKVASPCHIDVEGLSVGGAAAATA